MNRIKIAISGLPNSGKTSVGQYIKSKLEDIGVIVENFQYKKD